MRAEHARDDGAGKRVGFAIERRARSGRLLLHAGRGLREFAFDDARVSASSAARLSMRGRRFSSI